MSINSVIRIIILIKHFNSSNDRILVFEFIKIYELIALNKSKDEENVARNMYHFCRLHEYPNS